MRLGCVRSLAGVTVNGAQVPGLISMGPVLPALSGCILSVEDKVPRFRLSYLALLTSSCGCLSSPHVGRHSATHRALQSCLFPPQLSTPRTIYLPHRVLHGHIAPLQFSTRRVTPVTAEQHTVAYPRLTCLHRGCQPHSVSLRRGTFPRDLGDSRAKLRLVSKMPFTLLSPGKI